MIFIYIRKCLNCFRVFFDMTPYVNRLIRGCPERAVTLLTKKKMLVTHDLFASPPTHTNARGTNKNVVEF